METTTIMHKKSNWKMSPSVEGVTHRQMENLLDTYGHENTYVGRHAIMHEWERNNGWLVDLFSKHPNYVPDKFYIRIPAKLQRPIDGEAVMGVLYWAAEEYYKLHEGEGNIGMFTYEEYTAMYDLTWDKIRLHGGRRGLYLYGEDVVRMETRIHEFRKTHREHMVYGWVKSTTYEVASIFHMLNCGETTLSEDLAMEINEKLRKGGLPEFAHKGAKITKFFHKLCVETGVADVTEIKERVWYVDDQRRTRTVDEGYNKKRAVLGDALSPKTYEQEVYISCNPIDYLTMSFGVKWASCHTIDKGNQRNCSCTYSGEYCGGTMSYMLDNSSFIVYVAPDQDWLDKNRETELPVEERSKLKRCVFWLGEDKLFQSRVYPDGRDGGDQGISAQLRHIVQEAIATCYSVPNTWKLVREIRHDEIITEDGSAHYEDYHHYDDVTTSYLKRDGKINHRPITVGHMTICPKCGDEHDDSTSELLCNECNNMCYCDRCDDRITLEDAIFVEGNYYCSPDCAEEAGYVYCVDTEDWRSSCYATQDSYTLDWYYWDDDFFQTVEGDHYASEENAEMDGCMYADYDEVWSSHANRILEIGTTNEYFYVGYHRDYVETADGLYYPDLEMAEETGYVRTADGRLVAV